MSWAPFAAVERQRQEILCASTTIKLSQSYHGWVTWHHLQEGPSPVGLPSAPEAARRGDCSPIMRKSHGVGQGVVPRVLEAKSFVKAHRI